MKILLTGGLGYIATHTAVALSQKNHHVVLFDNLCNSSANVLRQLKLIAGVDFPFIQGDVRDTNLLQETLASHKIDAVFHFAGLKAVGESVERPIDYFENNVQGTISLLRAMQELKIKSLVFSSSATVYGQPQYLPYDEAHPTGATSPYGRSKLHIEEMLQDLAFSDPDWRIACLRYFNPVGAHESGLIGENPRGIPNNLMPYIAQVASGQRDRLHVFGNDYATVDGTGVRDYIHVMDLAQGHMAAMDFLMTQPGCHVFNLGAGKGHSVLEMIQAFETASGRRVPYHVTARRPGDVAAYFADPSKAHQLLKWKATRSIEEMCASAWRFQQAIASIQS